MPMLADIEDPPKSRVRGMLLGLALATPFAALFLGWLIPMLVGTVLGGARDLDSRLREQDAYMQSVCTLAMDLERDEGLCSCVLAMDFPSLDCQAAFRRWAVARQVEQCAGPETRERALSFCTCVDTLARAVAEVPPEGREAAAEPYARCAALPDALPMPPVESLQTSPGTR
jgi:hypothetical protein